MLLDCWISAPAVNHKVCLISKDENRCDCSDKRSKLIAYLKTRQAIPEGAPETFPSAELDVDIGLGRLVDLLLMCDTEMTSMVLTS